MRRRMRYSCQRSVKKYIWSTGGDALRASMVYQNALKDSPVEFLWNSRIEEILHEKKVTGVRLSDVKTGKRGVSCDGVFVAIGPSA